MRMLLRLAAQVVILVLASVAWVVLGGIVTTRTGEQQADLYGSVADLWGTELRQEAPTVSFEWQAPVERSEPRVGPDGQVLRGPDGSPLMRHYTVLETRSRAVELASTDLAVDLSLDQRRKGLMWFSLYDVDFQGSWAATHDGAERGELVLRFAFPVTDGSYDGFTFAVDGEDRAREARPTAGVAEVRVPVEPGQTVDFAVGYRSRGLGLWEYRPTPQGVGQLEDFALTMTTDFADVDFPPFTMSPSTRTTTGSGETLTWTFERLVTGHGMGMVMPERVQPGPLAASLAFSAPVSLALFMAWLTVLGLLRRIEIHPMHHLLIAGAFFAFHLLFAYTADHLPVEAAFALSAGVSVALVVSYLRRVVSTRFALVEAGLAQLLYLVGFSLAHFWDGFTGLTITVLGIVTLFALMQMTGRLDWDEVFASRKPEPAR